MMGQQFLCRETNSGYSNKDVSFVCEAIPVDACIQAPGGLVAWYPGDGNTDDIVFGNNGVYDGPYAPGKVDQAFSIRGSSQVVTVQNSSVLESQTVSIDCWIRGTAPNDYKWIVSKGASNCDSGSYGLFTTPIPNNIKFIVWNGGSFDGMVDAIVPGIWDDNWHLVAGTYDGTEVKLYVDGILVASRPYSGGIAYGLPSHNNLIIGGYVGCASGFNNFSFDGDVCEVEIFNRALSAGEVLSIFNAGSDGKCKTNELEVDILVKGVRKSNCRKIQMTGVTPVIIYGSESLDVSWINCSSLKLNGLSVKINTKTKVKGDNKYGAKNNSPGTSGPDCACNNESSGSKKTGCKIKYVADCQYPVLVAYFDNTSGYWSGSPTVAELTGVLLDGTPIHGQDTLC